MNNKTLGIIVVLFGGLAIFSEQEGAWIVSAIAVGVGTGIFFWKNSKNNIDN
ncbi:MAG: hypothetical protein FD549_000241 [Pelagibacterales bacterium]|jgi:hypothetical protein|nr:hypothetical protein [Pelagibacterales bacterium]|tara:strand:+ start:594 stop:749 length:156 start_codon:yes stop_codon:yes gene_type:complete